MRMGILTPSTFIVLIITTCHGYLESHSPDSVKLRAVAPGALKERFSTLDESALRFADKDARRASAWAVVPRGGATTDLLPSKGATARFASVLFWLLGVTSAADAVRGWEHTGLNASRGSLAEWFSERHGWVLMSLGTLVALSEGSSLSPTHRVVLSFIPSLYYLFSSFYSGRLKELNLESTVPALLFLHHAALLVGVAFFNLNIPAWALDGPLWLSAVLGILVPDSAMQYWGVDTKKSTVTDKILFIFQGHADLVYAAAIRASLSATSGVGALVHVMKWSWTAWCASFVPFYVLRADLVKLLTTTTASQLMGPMAILATARMHLSK